MLKSITSNQKALFALVWVCFFWGTTWMASGIGVKYMPAVQLAAMRQFLGGAAYLIYFTATKQPLPKGKQWRTILILSFFNFMLTNGLTTWGVKYISSGLASIIAAIFPLWIVIFAFFEGEKLDKKSLLGLLLGFSGVCIIFYNHLKDFLNADFRFGIFISFIATFSWALGSIYTKKNVANFNPYFSLGFQMVISSIALYGISYATKNTVSLLSIPAISWCAILYLIIFGNILTFIAFIYALQKLPSSLSSLYAYINPMVAVLLGAIIFKERLNIYIGIGGLVTIAGVYLVNDSFKKRQID